MLAFSASRDPDAYDGREEVGKKRRRLRNKIATSGFEDAKRFGEDLVAAARVAGRTTGGRSGFARRRGRGVPARRKRRLTGARFQRW